MHERNKSIYDGSVEHHKKLAILVGGGPAPGINAVIGAATIRAALEGMDVVGVRDGFEWLMQGDIEHVTPLTIERSAASTSAAARTSASRARIRQRIRSISKTS